MVASNVCKFSQRDFDFSVYNLKLKFDVNNIYINHHFIFADC